MVFLEQFLSPKAARNGCHSGYLAAPRVHLGSRCLPPAARDGDIPCRAADCLLLKIGLTAVPAKPPDGMGGHLLGCLSALGLGRE